MEYESKRRQPAHVCRGECGLFAQVRAYFWVGMGSDTAEISNLAV